MISAISAAAWKKHSLVVLQDRPEKERHKKGPIREAFPILFSRRSDQGQAVGDGHSVARGMQETVTDFRQTLFREASDHFSFFR